jgi:hypothetical protein
MIAYQTSETGRYVGTVVCDESPLEPGVFLLPRGAVTVAPPSLSGREFAVWDGSAWLVDVDPPEPEPEPEPTGPTREHVEAYRRREYQRESDPVFFDWQRGKATEQDWFDAVQAVKDAHPYPEGDS